MAPTVGRLTEIQFSAQFDHPQLLTSDEISFDDRRHLFPFDPLDRLPFESAMIFNYKLLFNDDDLDLIRTWMKISPIERSVLNTIPFILMTIQALQPYRNSRCLSLVFYTKRNINEDSFLNKTKTRSPRSNENESVWKITRRSVPFVDSQDESSADNTSQCLASDEQSGRMKTQKCFG